MKKVGLGILNVSLVIVTVIMSVFSLVYAYYATIGKNKLPSGVTSTYATTITNAKVVNCELKGDGANKSGYVVGTVNANTTITTSNECAGNTVFGVADSTAVYGRISGATLILNGVTLPW